MAALQKPTPFIHSSRDRSKGYQDITVDGVRKSFKTALETPQIGIPNNGVQGISLSMQIL